MKKGRRTSYGVAPASAAHSFAVLVPERLTQPPL
jgi:hypothetical protein